MSHGHGEAIAASESLRVGLGLLSVYPSRNAGTTTYVRGLLGGFSELDRREDGLEVFAMMNDDMADACRDLGDDRVQVAASSRFAMFEQRVGRIPSLALASARGKVFYPSVGNLDLVHYIQTVRAPRIGLPVVVTLHDVLHLDCPQLFSPTVRSWRRMMYDASARRADAIITVSSHARERIVDHLGVDPSVVHVVHHGVDSKRFSHAVQPDDPALRKALGVDGSYLFYPASLSPHKNHGALIQALRYVPDKRVVLVGPASSRLEQLLSEADGWGVRDRVQHLGMVVPEALPALYRGAHCLVFPSLYEGFGLPILEAMACGCPVVCSDAGPSAEIAGNCALLVNAKQPEGIVAAVREFDSATMREDYATRGLRRAGGFSWLAAARGHQLVYDSVLGRDATEHGEVVGDPGELELR